jgi:uncharacterized membrane protein
LRIDLSPLDLAALAIFATCWLGYQPLLRRFMGGGGVINADMTAIRGAWMRNMVARENRFMDVQLLGHALNSASFFASSNLILIAAAAGALFGGEAAFRTASSLEVLRTSSRLLFEFQLAMVIITLARGLLDFIWSIRQMNYCLAAMGAAPDAADEAVQARYAEVTARLLNPALSTFSAGVRGYYFALAAAAWLFGPIPLIVATLGATAMLIWRQKRSPAAAALRDLRRLIDAEN